MMTHRTQLGRLPAWAILRDTSAPARQKSEGIEGGGADAVGAAVYVEEDPVSLSSIDEVAATARTRTAIRVMLFNVVADLLTTTQHLAIWAEK